MSAAIQLSPNFFLSEFLVSNEGARRGIRNVPDPMTTKNLFATAAMLEEVRAALGGSPILISSGLRVPELNRIVGGSANSEHITGDAVDFSAPRYGGPLKICRAILKAGIKFGQLIYEGDWVHISRPGRFNGQVLTARFTIDPMTGKQKTFYSPGLPQ